jgi:hypothetical protein
LSEALSAHSLLAAVLFNRLQDCILDARPIRGCRTGAKAQGVRRMKHGPEIQAEILAELVAGAAPFALARKFGIARSTIEHWRDRAGLGNVRREKREALEDRGMSLLNA